MINPLN